MKPKVILTTILALVAIVLFGYAILMAFIYSRAEEPSNMSSFLNWVILVISGALATNLGSALGIKIQRAGRFTFGFKGISSDTSLVIRWICAYLYVAILIAALIFWGTMEFEDDPTKIVDSIPNLSKTLVGVGVGVIASL